MTSESLCGLPRPAGRGQTQSTLIGPVQVLDRAELQDFGHGYENVQDYLAPHFDKYGILFLIKNLTSDELPPYVYSIQSDLITSDIVTFPCLVT